MVLANKIKNPETNRYVKKSGKVGKEVLAKYYTKSLKSSRLILKDGATYKKQKKEFQNNITKTLEEFETNIKTEEKERYDNIDKMISNEEYTQIFENALFYFIFLNEKQINMLWNKLTNNKKMLMKIVLHNRITEYRPICNSTKSWIVELLTTGIKPTTVFDFNSDGITGYIVDNIGSIEIVEAKKPMKIIKNKSGEFFAYVNTTAYDLSRYQIFNQEQAYDNSNKLKNIHCLIHTLTLNDVEEVFINNVKLAFYNKGEFRKKDLNKIATIIKRDIVLYHRHNKDGETDHQKYTAVEVKYEPIHMAIYENHYFKYEYTDISVFSVRNYEDIKHLPDFKNIVKKRGKGKYTKTAGKSKINSLTLVDKLFKQGYFKQLDLIKFTEKVKHKKLKNLIFLDNLNNEQREFKESNKEPIGLDNIFYADCESYVYDIKKEHKLQLLGFVNNTCDIVDIYNVNDEINKSDKVSNTQKMIYRWLDAMTYNGRKDAICYFHNLKYDYYLLEPYLNIHDICQKDGNIYNVVIIYKKKRVELRDSYKLIPFGLSKFQSEFNLPQEFAKKEAIAYRYYTEENNGKRCKVKEYANMLTRKDKVIFRKNLLTEPSYNANDETFNPMEYYKEYLRLDCLVLMKGLQKFEEIINRITEGKLSIYECLTISSLTDKFMIKEGCYEGVYEVQGNLRAYISKAIYGGRVCVNEKHKKKIIKGKISDYDAVSCYPSAIYRLCKIAGIAIGKAKRLLKENFSKWESYDYSIMTVMIKKVNKKQQIPFIACKPDIYEGDDMSKDVLSTKYSNEAPSVPVIIDKYTLQDYIKFHEIEYEIMEGVYWNDGYNNKMGDVIEKLFNYRLKAKTDKNEALANVIKLMLNSAYGKTIMKKCNTKIDIVKSVGKNKINGVWETSDRKIQNYIYNNFGTILKYRQMNGTNYEITKTAIDNSYNRGQAGCAILSISKRIMNEVFDTANTHKLPIYYTDTDSMHLNYNDIQKLEKEYNKKYKRNINGKNLGQFHTDFKLKGAVGEIYATTSIFYGRKSYYDELESVDKDGKIITGTHVRLKGITKEGIEHELKKYKGDTPCRELFKDLINGVEKVMCLNPYDEEENSQKVLFEFKDGKVMTRQTFTRTLNKRN